MFSELLRRSVAGYARRSFGLRASASGCAPLGSRASFVSRAWRDWDRPAQHRAPPAVPLPSGVLVAHKPQEWTSFNVCAAIRGTFEEELRGHGRRFTRRRRLKVRHGGTLDPLAEGVMIIGVGDSCKLLNGYLKGDKGYVARARLGRETNTQDVTGEVTVSRPFDHVKLEDLKAAADALTGEIMQRPPVFSALKKGGKRAHDLARRGEVSEEDMEPRPVSVHKLQVRAFDAASGEFELAVRCGGGTYVRTLILDIGRAVGSAAHMSALLRTRVGRFCIAQDADADAGHVVRPVVWAGPANGFGDTRVLRAAMADVAAVLDQDENLPK